MRNSAIGNNEELRQVLDERLMPITEICITNECDKSSDCYAHNAKIGTDQKYDDFHKECVENDYINYVQIIDKQKFMELYE